MTEDQKAKAHIIIHSHAALAAAGNLVPAPGAGVAVDLVTMTSMSFSLCAVFGGNVSDEVAKVIAIATFKNTMLKQPVKVLARELSKLIPYAGELIAPSMSFAMIEAAGWNMAFELERAARRA